MATYIQLDEAARMVGKSEITVRRLVKAGKISHRKEKTLTGFVYLVDPNEILGHYNSDAPKVEPVERLITPESPEPELVEPTAKQVRVAVAGESGNLTEYWQKRAETYEDRYYRELDKQAQLREELGTWRGRAEQAQSILTNLLPAHATDSKEKTEETAIPETPVAEAPTAETLVAHDVPQPTPALTQHVEDQIPRWFLLTVAVLGLAILGVAAMAVYLAVGK